MTQVAISVRLDEVIIRRLDALLEALQADEEFRIHYPKKLKRTDAIRNALIRGLVAGEEEYGINPETNSDKPKSRRTKPKA